MSDAEVILELPQAWFANPSDGDRHRHFFASIWLALGDLGVTVRPICLTFGADAAPRLAKQGQLIISFHSHGDHGNILRLKESYLPPYYTVDRLGYSGFSELAKHPERFSEAINSMDAQESADFIEALKSRTIAANLSKYDQPRMGVENLPDRFVFQPLQTVDDPVAGFHQLDQLEVLAGAAEAAEALGWSVIFKRHPLCRSVGMTAGLRHLLAVHPNLSSSDASVHSLIPAAQAVIGANSGVLFEALLHGAHVISFGHSDFAMATTRISDRREIAGALLGRGRVDRLGQCRFLAWYLQHYCVAVDDVAAIRGRIAAALAALDRGADRGWRHQEQQELFEYYATREAARRRAVLETGDPAP